MNLIFVYGPPAVGKLTVGRALAERTGYRLFHNHLTVPVVRAIFPDHDPARSVLLKKLRVTSIAAAAQAGIDLIFTVAYSGKPGDPEFVQEIVDAVKAVGGEIMFVELYATDEALLERVQGDSRRAPELQKMMSAEEYAAKLPGRNNRASVDYPVILRIDNTNVGPREVSEVIVQYFDIE